MQLPARFLHMLKGPELASKGPELSLKGPEAALEEL